jgi:hypothetical protein
MEAGQSFGGWLGSVVALLIIAGKGKIMTSKFSIIPQPAPRMTVIERERVVEKEYRHEGRKDNGKH